MRSGASRVGEGMPAAGWRLRPRGTALGLLAAALAALPAPAGGASGPDLAFRTPVARLASPAASQRSLSREALQRELAAQLRRVGGSSGTWVYDPKANHDRVLFSSSASSRRVPASNQKLFTTAAFLDRFGAVANLETQVFTRGRWRPGGAVIRGDLVIVGVGDPALGTAGFARRNDLPLTPIAKLAKDVAQAGVKRVKGTILADDTIFDRQRRSGPYLSPLSGLSFNSGYVGGEYAADPELEAARALKRALRRRGVRVRGRVGRARLRPGRREPIGSVLSPPVATLIARTNKPSNNFFAEMLLKGVAASTGKRGTTNRGARQVERFAERVGTSVEAADGSGLSRRNRVSPRQVGKLLVAMADGPRAEANAFAGSLAIAGRDGTLADRMRGTAAEGNCRGKTGTLDGVSALSGYCDAGPRMLAFSILMNGVDVNTAREAQDRMAAAIARYRP